MWNLRDVLRVTLVLATFEISDGSFAQHETTDCFNGMSVIRKLVQSGEYDKSMRPCKNGEPVVVEVGIYIVSINNIEESDMEFDIQIYFRQQWKDHRLSFDNLNITDREHFIQLPPGSVWDKIWMPDPFFENEKSAKLHDVMKDNEMIQLYPDGVIFFSSRLTITFSCPMDFYDFPMDKQICQISLQSYSYSTESLIYKWKTNKTKTSVYSSKLTLPQFDIVKIVIGSKISSYIVGNYTVLTLDLHFQRRIAFYLTRNYIPAALVVVISWLSFWLNRDSAPARVGMGITTILTMTTLLIGFGQQGLPAVSYVRALDWYYFGCFAFVFATLCEYSIVNYLDVVHKRQVEELNRKAADEEKAEEVQADGCVDKYSSRFGMDFLEIDHAEKREQPEPKKLENVKLRSPLSDAIDNVFRKSYPLLFLAFNIIYWATYSKSYNNGR